MSMTPDELFSNAKKLFLPLLTQYHPGLDSTAATRPWLDNRNVNWRSPTWDGVRACDAIDLYPDDPFAPSKYREGGYAMWDFIVRNGRTTMRKAVSVNDSKPVFQLAGQLPAEASNTWWSQHVYEGYMRNQLDDCEMVMDMIKCPGLLTAAHALAHLRTDQDLPGLGFWKSYTFSSRAFLQAAAELLVAKSYDLPLNPFAPPDKVLPYGIAVRPTQRIGFTNHKPLLQEDYSIDTVIDQTFAYVSVAVEVGQDPLEMLLPGAESPYDHLAYQPRRLFVVGWTLAPWLFGQGLYWPEQLGWRQEFVRGAFTASCDDLFVPQSLSTYLEAARSRFQLDADYKPLDEWEDQLRALIGVTRPLPCPCCLLFNTQVQHGLQLAPTSWARAAKYNKEKILEYEKQLKKALKLVDSAKLAHYGKAWRRHRATRRRLYVPVLRERRAAKKRQQWR